MPDLDSVAQLGRRLLRQGVPGRHVKRIVREMAEHQDDLEAEARATGLLPEAARSWGCERLGDMDSLAKVWVDSRRGACWPGRHPFISFVWLPLPLFVFLFLGFIGFGAEVMGVAAWAEHRDILPEPDWFVVRLGFYTALGVALSLTASLTSWLARRCHCGFRWVLIGCGVIFLHAFFFNAGFASPHEAEYGRFWIGYRLRWPSLPELMAWAVPLFAFVLSYVCLRRAQVTTTST